MHGIPIRHTFVDQHFHAGNVLSSAQTVSPVMPSEYLLNKCSAKHVQPCMQHSHPNYANNVIVNPQYFGVSSSISTSINSFFSSIDQQLVCQASGANVAPIGKCRSAIGSETGSDNKHYSADSPKSKRTKSVTGEQSLRSPISERNKKQMSRPRSRERFNRRRSRSLSRHKERKRSRSRSKERRPRTADYRSSSHRSSKRASESNRHHSRSSERRYSPFKSRSYRHSPNRHSTARNRISRSYSRSQSSDRRSSTHTSRYCLSNYFFLCLFLYL